MTTAGERLDTPRRFGRIPSSDSGIQPYNPGGHPGAAKKWRAQQELNLQPLVP